MSKQLAVMALRGMPPLRRRPQAYAGARAQRGFVLIATLLLLIIMSILAVGMFRGVDVQEMIAGNLREKQRSLQAAIDAEQAAEYWLSIGGNALLPAAPCNSPAVSANTGTVQACSNILSQVAAGGVTQVPWTVGGVVDVGFTYNPGNGDITPTGTAGPNTYNDLPRFYISFLANASTSNPQPVYQIDAWSPGATRGTITEVESTWQVTQVVNSGIQGGSTGN